MFPSEFHRCFSLVCPGVASPCTSRCCLSVYLSVLPLRVPLGVSPWFVPVFLPGLSRCRSVSGPVSVPCLVRWRCLIPKTWRFSQNCERCSQNCERFSQNCERFSLETVGIWQNSGDTGTNLWIYGQNRSWTRELAPGFGAKR